MGTSFFLSGSVHCVALLTGASRTLVGYPYMPTAGTPCLLHYMYYLRPVKLRVFFVRQVCGIVVLFLVLICNVIDGERLPRCCDDSFMEN